MSRYPGFEVFSEGAQDSSIQKEVIRLNLTKELGGASLDCATSLIIIGNSILTCHIAKVTESLSEEASFALGQTFTDQRGEDPRRYYYHYD
jgi:hypothetical protein